MMGSGLFMVEPFVEGEMDVPVIHQLSGVSSVLTIMQQPRANTEPSQRVASIYNLTRLPHINPWTLAVIGILSITMGTGFFLWHLMRTVANLLDESTKAKKQYAIVPVGCGLACLMGTTLIEFVFIWFPLMVSLATIAIVIDNYYRASELLPTTQVQDCGKECTNCQMPICRFHDCALEGPREASHPSLTPPT